MANFLRLAGEVIEKWEKALWKNPENLFLLNEAQCTHLWRNIRRVYDAFAPSFSYPAEEQGKCVHIFIDFYIVVVRGSAIVEMCSCKESWLRAALFYGDNQRIFQELSVALQSCVDSAHKLTKSLFYNSSTHEPVKFLDDIVILHNQAHVDFQRDIIRLNIKLRDLVEQPSLLFFLLCLCERCSTEERKRRETEKHLANYLLDRQKFKSSTDHLDLNHRVLIPAFFETNRQYPTQGDVHRSGHDVAVSKVDWLGLRCAKKEFLGEAVDMTAFVKEVNALVGLNHPNIVKLLCSQSATPSKPSFLMEFVDMSLSDFLQDRKRKSMPIEIVAALDLMLQMALGMEYLHGQFIVHRDLKSPNILVTPSCHPDLQSMGYAEVKVTDFGLAKVRVFDPKEPTHKKIGTVRWMAPEAIEPKGRIDWRKADTYSFAITCSEILTCEIPYCEFQFPTEVYERVKGGARPALPQGCPDYLKGFLEMCWAENPSGRPSFEKIVGTLKLFKTHLLLGTVPERGSPWEEISVPPTVFLPSESEQYTAAIASIQSRLEALTSICDRMNEHREQVKICPVQCGHLIDEYLEGVEKVKSTYHHLDFDDKISLFRSNKLQCFIVSLSRLICSVMAAEELVRTCCGTEWKMTALAISAPFSTRRVLSRFGMNLLELYWNLFAIHHVLQNFVRTQTPETLPQLLCTNDNLWIGWCENEVKLVLKPRNSDIGDLEVHRQPTKQVVSIEGGDAEDKFLKADAERQDQDRNLLSEYLNERPVCESAHDTIPPELAVLLKKKLLGTWKSVHGPKFGFASQEDSFYIDHVQFDTGKVLGRGTFKRVMECSWLGVEVAVAEIEYFETREIFEDIERLVRVQLHPNVVHCIGYHVQKFDLEIFEGRLMKTCTFMELMESDLHDLIRLNRAFYSGSPFPLPVTIDILLQIVEAMLHVHQCGVLHRDLKPQNILVQPKYSTDQFNTQDLDLDLYYSVKLTDFFSAKGANSLRPLNSGDRFYTQKRGTICYMAPEVWKSSGVGYTTSADVWSFGMTAYHIITGSVPLESLLAIEVRRTFSEGKVQDFLDFGDTCPERLKMLIKSCWALNPDTRLSFEEIRKGLWTLKKDYQMNFERNVVHTYVDIPSPITTGVTPSRAFRGPNFEHVSAHCTVL